MVTVTDPFILSAIYSVSLTTVFFIYAYFEKKKQFELLDRLMAKSLPELKILQRKISLPKQPERFLTDADFAEREQEEELKKAQDDLKEHLNNVIPK